VAQVRRFNIFLGGTVAALAAGLSTTMPANAAALGCGSIVTGTVALQADILGCAGDGLVVGGPNTTIDLNGFTIAGTRIPGSIGIRINGHGNVVIRSSAPFASVAEFDVGIRAVNTTGLTVSDVTTQAVNFGLRLERSSQATIRGNNLGFAERVPDCNAVTAPAGIRVANSHSISIENNAAQLTGYGILLIAVDDSTLRGNGAAPTGSDGNTCIGIALVDSDRNLVVGNTVTENRGGATLAGDGITVDLASRLNTLRANQAMTNSDDGIEVRNRTTKLLQNVADRNDDLGIKAVVGVIASGNRAAGNGDPRQCVNVACSPS
jgi:parallel beta-helix repeat protein